MLVQSINPASKRAYNDYQRRSIKKGFTIELTIDQFIDLASKPCHYCDSLPSNIRRKDKHTFYYNGIDRIDSSKGYLLDNVLPCCWVCNRAKGDMPYAEFIRWIDRLMIAQRGKKRAKKKAA